ncbi:hypothetical protein HDU96_000289 [Phlyctochytrium bullatum]|nr:hypothetical protein HDU96_000289 [Phlyctochytrium bullatum]
MAFFADKKGGKTKAAIDKMVESIQAAVMKDVFAKLQNETLIELKTSIVADVLEQINDIFGARLDALQESIPKPMSIEDYLEEEEEEETEKIDKGKAPATTPTTSTWCPKLGTVLPEYAANPSEDKVLVSEEFTEKGARQFIVWTTEKFRQASLVGDPHFYEMVPVGVRCKLYFDINISVKNCAPDDFKRLSSNPKRILDDFNRFASHYLKRCVSDKEAIRMLVLSGTRKDKVSFHIIYNVMFPTKIFRSQLCRPHLHICTKSVQLYFGQDTCTSAHYSLLVCIPKGEPLPPLPLPKGGPSPSPLPLRFAFTVTVLHDVHRHINRFAFYTRSAYTLTTSTPECPGIVVFEVIVTRTLR